MKMTNIEALQWRYATKRFDKDRLLPEEKVEILRQAFNLTATSYGLQPIKLVVIHNKKVQAGLVKHSMNQQQVATASHLFIICIERKVDKRFIEDYFNHVHKVRATPTEILKPFQEFLIKDFQNKSVEEVTAWAVNQAYLALGTLLTVCATEAIDACPMEGFEPEGYETALGLQELNLKPVLVLPVGFRANDDMFQDFKKVRRPISDVVIDLEFPDKEDQ